MVPIAATTGNRLAAPRCCLAPIGQLIQTTLGARVFSKKHCPLMSQQRLESRSARYWASPDPLGQRARTCFKSRSWYTLHLRPDWTIWVTRSQLSHQSCLPSTRAVWWELHLVVLSVRFWNAIDLYPSTAFAAVA